MASRLADAGEQAGNCRLAEAGYAGNCGAGGSTGGAGMLFS